MAGKKPTSSCPNWQILLGEYALGTIGERDRARLEVHLASCPACRRALAATEKLYEFMAGYELAQASPSLATKVADALRREMPARAPVAAPIPRPAAEPVAAPTPEYEPRRAGKPWWRVPAFVTALGTAAAAATVAVLYFKVWAPGQEPGTEEALSGRYPEALAAKSAAPPSAAVPPVSSPGKGSLARPAGKGRTDYGGTPGYGGTAALRADEGAVPLSEPAETPRLEVSGEKDKTVPGDRAKESASIALTEERTEVEKKAEEYVATAPAEIAADYLEELRAAGGASGGGIGAASAERDDGAGILARSATVAPVGPSLEDVMEPRIGEDVERLTAEDGALLDYVTPNGTLMTYFYELSPEEQEKVLTRLKAEIESEPAAEMFLGH